jgi:hypothetical protein
MSRGRRSRETGETPTDRDPPTVERVSRDLQDGGDGRVDRKRLRTNPFGIPIMPESVPQEVATERTPFPVDVLQIMMHDPAQGFKLLAERVWEHSANVELRANQNIQSSSAGQLQKQIEELKERLDLTIGIKGDNGKLGKVTARVKLLYAVIGAVGMAALGSLGVALSAAHDAGERDGRTEARLLQLEHDRDRQSDQIQGLWPLIFKSPGGTP